MQFTELLAINTFGLISRSLPSSRFLIGHGKSLAPIRTSLNNEEPMVATNLTKQYKQAIVDKAIDQSPNAALIKNQIAAEHILADTVRVELLGGVKQVININALILQIDDLLAKLPASVHRRDRHYLSWGTTIRFTLASTGEVKTLQLGEWMCLPQHYAPTLDNPKLEQMVISHLNLSQQLIADRLWLTEKLWSVLNSVNSVKKLLKVWPESRELLDSLPAPESEVNIVDLNKALHQGVN